MAFRRMCKISHPQHLTISRLSMDETIGINQHPQEKFKDYDYSKRDKQILRELAEKKVEIASLSIHKEKIEMWINLNDLKDVRPMIWINEIPWHEMDIDNELKLQTSTEFTQKLEADLRKTIYRWNHMPADMVVEPVIFCYLEVKNSGFGITEIIDVAITDEKSDIYSREFISQIDNEEDIQKIRFPEVVYYKEDTDRKYEVMSNMFKGVIEIRKSGYPGFWFAPWDELIRWWGVQKLLEDLIIRPELIHKIMKKLTEAYLFQLDQYESLNLLSENNGNYRIGSGGLGYTNDLPFKKFENECITAGDLWGNAAAQIFSNVSPKMHLEFALNYEILWMKRFGLNYYGCCEPLDKKIEILKKIPNLRKISMSPWTDLGAGASNIGRDYVFSFKPNPSIFIQDSWDPESIKRKLFNDLSKIKKCNVEIIMKDISTVKNQPQRLWEWARIANETVQEII